MFHFLGEEIKRREKKELEWLNRECLVLAQLPDAVDSEVATWVVSFFFR